MGLEENEDLLMIMRAITGCCVTQFRHDYQKLMDEIQEALSSEYLVTSMAGQSEASQRLLESIGLESYYIYSIVSIDEAAKAIKLRTIHGHDYSLPLEVRNKIQGFSEEEQQNHYMWITYDHFSLYFTFVNIVKI